MRPPPQSASASRPAGAPPRQASPTRVWLVDDSPRELERTRTLLAGAVDGVETFAEGASLLEHLARPGVTPPDLLVLDWHMPGVSGLDALRFLRERHSATQLPVLVLTASTDVQDLEEAFEAGANDFVAKPVRAMELLARVRTLVAVHVQAEALRASEERYRTLFESLDDGYCLLQLLFDAEGRPVDYRFLEANAAFAAQTGLRDPVGRTARELVPDLDAAWFERYGRVARTGTPERFESDAPAMGRSFEVQVARVGPAALRQVALVFKDVTARRAAERLAALDRERAGFEQQLIGIVSHDLRNPIAAILMGAAVLLRRPDVDERQRRTVERILTSAGRADRMVHDLLDFTQARLGGGLSAVRVPGDVHAVVRQVVDEAQVSNPGRAVQLVQSGDGQGAWDADRLAQLVGNLLSNALQHGPPDMPVHVESRGEGGHVHISVHNAGAPIPPDVLPRLFQPLQRGGTGVSEVRSVGLGLYIVDQVVRAHAGTVEVASTAGAGTTFTVRLPRAAP